jgi:hypothetical protein
MPGSTLLDRHGLNQVEARMPVSDPPRPGLLVRTMGVVARGRGVVVPTRPYKECRSPPVRNHASRQPTRCVPVYSEPRESTEVRLETPGYQDQRIVCSRFVDWSARRCAGEPPQRLRLADARSATSATRWTSRRWRSASGSTRVRSSPCSEPSLDFGHQRVA